MHRVDVFDASLGHIHLVFAHCRDGGQYLSVHVGEAHAVVVYQVYGSHTRPGEHLNGISAHASYAEHGHP